MTEDRCAPHSFVESNDVLLRFHEHLELVASVVRVYRKGHNWRFDEDDLMSAGRQGLLDAARRFDPARGVPFTAYARLRIRGEIIDEIRRNAQLTGDAYKQAVALRAAAMGAAHEVSESALEIAHLRGDDVSAVDAEAALEELMASYVAAAAVGVLSNPVQQELSAEFNVEDAYSHQEVVHFLRKQLEEMDERMAMVVRGRYFESKTIDDLAVELDCDRSWVSRIHSKGISWLGRRLREYTFSG